jgi:hypothetical protein
MGADMFLDEGVDIGKGADGARDRPGRHFGAGVDQAGAVAGHFGVEAREGQAHGGGFGMDAVAAADADGVLVLKGASFQRGQHPVDPLEQQIGGAHQLDVQRGVEHIRRGHPLMHEARGVIADDFGQMGQEGDDVVFGDGLDLVDPGHVEGDVLGFPDGVGIGLGDHAQAACASQAWASISNQMRKRVWGSQRATMSGRE